eukprot:766484-Hanusia_phi.AAC.4
MGSGWWMGLQYGVGVHPCIQGAFTRVHRMIDEVGWGILRMEEVVIGVLGMHWEGKGYFDVAWGGVGVGLEAWGQEIILREQI